MPDQDHDYEAEGYQHDDSRSLARDKYTKGGEILKVRRAKSNIAHVNQFFFGFDPANVDSAAEDNVRYTIFPQTPRPVVSTKMVKSYTELALLSGSAYVVMYGMEKTVRLFS